MYKFLILVLFSSITFGQKTMPVLPECKDKVDVDDINSCFKENFNKSISKTITYLASSSEYLLIPEQDINLRIKINNKGEINLGNQEDNIHPLFYQLIEFYVDQLNEKNLAKGGVKPAFDENKKVIELNFKLPVTYKNPNVVNDSFRSYQRVLSINVDKKTNFYHLILTPDFKFSLLKNNQEFKKFNTIREYLDFSKKLLFESSYLEKDFNIVNVKNGLTIMSNHWLTPSENSKRIILKDKSTNKEYYYDSIGDFLESPFTELIFSVE